MKIAIDAIARSIISGSYEANSNVVCTKWQQSMTLKLLLLIVDFHSNLHAAFKVQWMMKLRLRYWVMSPQINCTINLISSDVLNMKNMLSPRTESITGWLHLPVSHSNIKKYLPKHMCNDATSLSTCHHRKLFLFLIECNLNLCY